MIQDGSERCTHIGLKPLRFGHINFYVLKTAISGLRMESRQRIKTFPTLPAFPIKINLWQGVSHTVPSASSMNPRKRKAANRPIPSRATGRAYQIRGAA